ncbi:acyl transferase/acyl hydrolase/lysophospholipase [Gautieria morchelliformis]|nr:acyl transferase/acyl hydrolase/lysophospholipase [Gautieria morchelliformis]
MLSKTPPAGKTTHFLGLELATEKLCAVVDVDEQLDLVAAEAVYFDTDLSEYRTHGSILMILRTFHIAGYIASISSDLFNEFSVSAAALLASPAGPTIELINATFGPQEVCLDSAAVPNPFKGINPNMFANTNEDFVTLVDGGSDGEQIPIQPLLVGARAVDTIIAIDVSADTADNFANGTEFINSAKRAALFGSLYPFPTIPSTADIFVQQNLRRHPTFCGCNDSVETPMIIYITNGGPPAEPEEVRAFIDQVFDITTQGIAGDASD